MQTGAGGDIAAFRKKVDLTSVERVLQKGSNSNVLLFLLLHKVVFEHFLIVFYFSFKEIDHVVFENSSSLHCILDRILLTKLYN